MSKTRQPPGNLALVWLGLIVLATLASACTLIPAEMRPDGEGTGGPFPDACPDFELSERRCAHIVDRMAGGLGVDRARVREIVLLGDPGCGGEPGELCNRTQSFVIRVRFTLDDGATREESQFCGVGGQYTLSCTETPEIRLSAPTLDGYQDIPCAGEPPDGCASPVPTIDPDVTPLAAALRIDRLDIPLDHPGEYDIPLGTAVLPNGVLTEASLALENPIQDLFLVAGEGAVQLVVTGPDGEPIWNVYEQGWREGTEEVDVRLVFTIEEAEPGALLTVRDVVVR